MYKVKKTYLYLLTLIYIILTIIELFIYIKNDASIFGLYYLIISVIIIFLLVPIAINYKKYYSPIRISKLIIIIILGLISSYLLFLIISKSILYVDNSSIYIKKIFITKSIIKPILYITLIVFTIFEFKSVKLISKNISKNSLD